MSISQKLQSLGSSPRSSEGIYNKTSSLFSNKSATPSSKSATPSSKSATPSSKSSSLFSSKPSVSRLMNAPVETVTGAVADANAPPSLVKPNGGSFWRYLIIFLIIVFLGVNLLLFLIKPADKDITHLYDPITTIFKGGSIKHKEEKKKTPAIEKLEKIIDKKPVLNKIDNDDPTAPQEKPTKNYKKLPVIPEADDSMSSVQKPASKSGFCYIGEDRGFRSCINVGEGDVCMSGDIFPTEAICINPNLRE